MSNHPELSFRQSVDRMVDRAIATRDLPLGLAEQIRSCNWVYQVQFGVKLGDHTRSSPAGAPSTASNPAGQGRHPLRRLRQPGRGRGARGADVIQVLHRDDPFGGSKGALKIDPRNTRKGSRENHPPLRAGIGQARPHPPQPQCARPRHGHREREMGWISDTYQPFPQTGQGMGCVTGKPVHLGGSSGALRPPAGRAVRPAEFFRHPRIHPRRARRLARGQADRRAGPRQRRLPRGQVPSGEDGATITTIIERDGAFHSANGLDVEAVKPHIAEHHGVKGFPGANYTADGASLLEADCDILPRPRWKPSLTTTTPPASRPRSSPRRPTARSPTPPTDSPRKRHRHHPDASL
ncbi:MAG: hypothetical protein CM1200mP34_5570 [Verrucomicrobiales bacterium]|nr:MAG: hypothetical protein CM1200mP34_5570 [Verrucomicrobiales bacterium]